MFTFFEGYMPECWDGYVKRGFIRPNTGIRFCENKMLPDEKKFNLLAAENSRFFNLVKEMNVPMYIDRLQGGAYIDEYKYDEELLGKYRDMLGEKFYGFQMHEWASNLRSDINKLVECTEWKKDEIEKEILRKFPFKYVFLEAMTSEELEKTGRPKTAAEFMAAVRWLLKNRIESAYDLVCCDSVYMAFKTELENGARFVMPEVGAQSPDSRLQINYAAGVSRSFKRDFGVYYEPWGGRPFSACCYQRENQNEWGIGMYENGGFPFETKGENGGSSRSLQERIFKYAYLSGASFISEEWGVCNTFYDWNDFEISPYGRTKLDFFSFCDKYPNVGKKLTPIAVVLPENLPMIENWYDTDRFCEYTLEKFEQDGIKFIKNSLIKIFGTEVPTLSKEKALVNNEIPDAVALIHSDAPDIGDYEYLIDLTLDAEFAKKHGNIINPNEINAVLEKTLPCTVTGVCHSMVNRRDDGGYYIAIWNHDGIIRSVEHGESVMSNAETTVRLTLKGERTLHKLEGSAKISSDENGYNITIPGGGWLFAEI